MIDSLLVPEEPSYSKGFNTKRKKNKIILIIVGIVIGLAVIGVIIYFTLPKKSSTIEWREVLRCRKGKYVNDTAMQLATLYNSGDGVLLCGGGSDIHPNTARPALYRSTDNGENWNLVYTGTSDMWSLYSFQRLPNNELIGIVPGKLLHSTDAGVTWTTQDMPDTGFSMQNGGGVLLISKNPNEIYRSTDNGRTYSTIKYCSSGCDNLRAITYAGNNTFFMGVGEEDSENGRARVFKTIDGGLNWSEVLTLQINSSDYVIFSVFAYDEQHVIVGAGVVKPGMPSMYYTTDGGKNWSPGVDITTFDETLKIVRSFYKGKDGRLYACCDCSYASSSLWADEPDVNTNSAILVSDDQGINWKLFSKTNTKRLYWITQADDGEFIAATGEFGQILKSRTKSE
ncbi:T9SS type A sorting domain-containing protein [Histomonas meleagridis]|uniref:T9SS type A sorting domain-containing protein n=1 Tax=Histomonas meleagridis TaxID=135588 RepID=UPI0035595AB6|nr:T9SS type A sorting domain-containing protein [Histomonas meleagridis]KAH0799664.1 T9SS type A sorting domain-containing protein [Histomonas meleagridis]